MSSDLSAWRAQAIRWLLAAAIAAITAFAFLFVSVLAQAGADGTPLSSKLESVSVTPTLKVALDADRSQAVPGDTISYEGVVSNDAATLSLGGDVAVLNRFSSGARLASYFAFIEYFAADTRKWTPLAGIWNREDGFTANQRPDIDTGLSLGLTRLTTPGVTFPAAEDSELGTSLAKGATAQWKLSAKAPLTHEQLRFLQDERQVKNIRLVVRFDLQQTGSNERDGETEKHMFTAGLRPLSSDLEDVVVTLGLPDGQLVEINKQDDPRLTRLMPGAVADFAGVFQLAALAERGLSESTLDYIDRLTGENGKRFNASASARATADTAASIDGAPVGDPRAVSSEEANVSTQQQLPIVSLAKSGPAEVGAGTSATYSFLLENIGSSTAWVTLTDEVDGGAPVPVEVSPSQVAPGEQARGEHTQHVSVKRKPGVMRDTGALNWLDRNDNSYGAVTDSFETMVIDITPPEPPVIGARPDPLTNKTTAQFTWTGEVEGFYQCRLDEGPWSVCGSPYEIGGVSEGEREFEVRQTDDSGNVGEPSKFEWTIDLTPPDLPKISSAVSGPTNATGAAFSFTGEPGGRFECQLDDAAWNDCSDPAQYFDMADGPHTFQVRQIDEAGNESADASREWAIDTVAPVAPNLVAVPDIFTNSLTAAFSFTSDDTVAFACSLDQGAYNPCFAPHFVSTPSEGPHEFDVRAIDEAGNQSPSSTHRWIVDLTPPQPPTILSAPSGTVSEDQANVEFEGEDHSTFQCAANGDSFANCESPFTIQGLESGDQEISVRQVDRAGNVSEPSTVSWSIVTGSGIDAPVLPDTPSSPLIHQVSFLYSGDDPVQTDVAPGTIDAKRVALIRGRVLSSDGDGLAGVNVSVKDHDEFGQTLSRPDGSFYMAVNGGQTVTLHFEKEPFIPVDRQIEANWQETGSADDVVMKRLSPVAETISLSGPFSAVQSFVGERVSDADGTRQSLMVFQPGTTAMMRFANGATTPMTSLTVRATEFTEGENGPAAMPGELPPQSAYTYAMEVSADEAIQAGAKTVEFSQPVPYYVDNFLGFDAGESAPLGYYDRDKAAWIAEPSGRVIDIVGESDGRALLNTNGDGVADSQAELAELGITPAEQSILHERYDAGDSVWRVTLTHLSAYDINWGIEPPVGADYPGMEDDEEIDCESKKTASVIECESQGLGEDVDVAGTPFSLHYRSRRTPGYENREIRLGVTTPLPGPVYKVIAKAWVAGRVYEREFTPEEANAKSVIATWDGMDDFGRRVLASQNVRIKVGYAYRPSYSSTGTFGYNGFGRISGAGTAAREYLVLWSERTEEVGGLDARGDGLGGWTISDHHTYDPIERKLLLGTGEKRTVGAISPILGSLVKNMGGHIHDMEAAADGSLYVARRDQSVNFGQIERVTPSGDRTVLYRTPTQTFFVSDMALDPQGRIVMANAGEVLRLDPNTRQIQRIAGTGVLGITGTGGHALDARIATVALDVGPDGSIYMGESDGSTHPFVSALRRIDPAGTVHDIMPPGTSSSSGDGGLIANARIQWFGSLHIANDGSIYVSDGQRVRRIGVDGVIRTAVGGGTGLTYQDGLPATSAHLASPGRVLTDAQNRLTLLDQTNRIRRVESDGTIHTIAGNPYAFNGGYAGDDGPATLGLIYVFRGLAHGPDGTLYFAQHLPQASVRTVKSAGSGFTGGDIVVPSQDGAELFYFSPEGRHLRTVDADTGQTRLTFEYDSQGKLAAVIDGDGERTSIARPTASTVKITGPDGHLTSLEVTKQAPDGSDLMPEDDQAGGFASAIIDPSGARHEAQYQSGGLLSSFTMPNGAQTQYVYDTDGRLISTHASDGAIQNLVRQEVQGGWSVTHTSAEGRETKYTTTTASDGSLTRSVQSPSGLVTRTVKDKADRTSVSTPDGMTASAELAPDPRFGMQAPFVKSAVVRTPGGKQLSVVTARSASPPSANPSQLVSKEETVTINGRAHKLTYTAADRKYVSTSAAGRIQSTVVDGQGRPSLISTPGLLDQAFVYDGRGRLAAANSGPRSSTFTYDTVGNLATVRDALGREQTFEHDAVGRVTRSTSADGRSVAMTYDPAGNITSITPPGRQGHIFSLTPFGQLGSYNPPSVAASSAATHYEYDNDRALTAIRRPDGDDVTVSYDSAGRAATVLDQAFGPTTMSYSPTTGNLTRLEAPQGQSTDFDFDGSLPLKETTSGSVTGNVSVTYDNDLRVTASKVNGANEVTNAFDADGLLTRSGDLSIARDAATGFITATSLAATSTSQTYNPFGELAGFTATVSGADLYQSSYTRDDLGRITTKTETTPAGTHTFAYTYDQGGRLIETRKDGATSASYTYDQNGNRTMRLDAEGSVQAGSYDAQDRVTTYGGNTYEHDASGDLEAKVTSTGARTTYAYDATASLRSVDLPDGRQIEYVIDGSGRRVGKKVDGTLTQGLLYGGPLQPVAELDSSGAVRSRFVYATKSSVPEYMVRGGVTYRMITDHLGSPRYVVNSVTGAVAQELDYDEFGRVIKDTNPGFQPFGFVGGLYDTDTGLVRFGARDYDPQTGRFTTKDPIGFAGGDTNLYGYVLGDPVNLIDPAGLYGVGSFLDDVGGTFAEIPNSISSGASAEYFSNYTMGVANGVTLGLAGKIAGVNMDCVGTGGGFGEFVGAGALGWGGGGFAQRGATRLMDRASDSYRFGGLGAAKMHPIGFVQSQLARAQSQPGSRKFGERALEKAAGDLYGAFIK